MNIQLVVYTGYYCIIIVVVEEVYMTYTSIVRGGRSVGGELYGCGGE